MGEARRRKRQLGELYGTPEDDLIIIGAGAFQWIEKLFAHS
jgi:hypothetical protein